MWTGVVRAEDADRYIRYVERTGMDAYRATPGNLGAWLLTRDLGDGRTRMHSTSLVDSLESRDMILSSGMEVGINDGYAKLDALLADGAV